MHGREDGDVMMHAGQLHLDSRTVRRLVGKQFPRLVGLPATVLLRSGSVNAIFRIGDELAARSRW